MPDWDTWPDVPDNLRPKRLPHNGLVDKVAGELLRGKGWDPIDVRLMSANSDAERGMCLKAFLEGVRLGTIEMDFKLQKFLDLEARALGLTSASRNPSEVREKDEIDKSSLDSIFGTMVDKVPSLYKPTFRTGRPPGSKNAK